MTRRSVVLSTTAAALILTLAACGSGSAAGSGGAASAGVASSSATSVMNGATGSTSSRAGSGIMNGGGGSAGVGDGPGMMNGDNNAYHYSRLSCSAPAQLPGHTVQVVLADMGMTQMMGGIAPMGSYMMLRATPVTVVAGQVSLVASNMGWRTHELVILPLAAGATAGQRVVGSDGKVSEAGSLGEASGSCAAGTGEGITAGQVGWTTVTLAPGHYELVCNLQNHYSDGMYQELIVA